ncbi:MAG: site-specific integrase, partial [Bacteroidota bacterium]
EYRFVVPRVVGSSPIGHPQKTREQKLLAQFKKKCATFVAHLDSKEETPGGVQTKEKLNDIVTMHSACKRWHVSYKSLNHSGKEVRRRSYGQINREKDPEKRRLLLIELHAKTTYLLLTGKGTGKPVFNKINIYKSVAQLIEDKKKYLKKKSIPSIEHHLSKFKEWLILTDNESKHPSEITKADIIKYRNWLLSSGIGNRTVNNNLSEVSGLFNYLIDSEDKFSYKNPVKQITRLPSRSETHVAYTSQQFQEMIDYMKEHDKELLFFIKLIAFGYFRTDEAKHLRVGDIDLPTRKITLSAEHNKGNKRTTKIIQAIIVDEFEKRNLSMYPEDYYLLSHKNRPGPFPVGENYFRKKFKKVKVRFGLKKMHTMYGFRHTSVTQLLEGGTIWTKAMDLTGHTNMESFQQYARSLLGKQAEDMSNVYTVKL